MCKALDKYMSKRNLVKEIINKRERTTSQHRLDAFVSRQASIDDSYKMLLDLESDDSISCDKELSRHYPVALVALVEGYFRSVIADLVNHGSPYVERATSLTNVKLNIETAAAIQNQQVTLGEYVAHFLSISNLEDINSSMSCLLGIDFLDHLISSEFNIFEDESSLTLREDRAEFISAVKDMFNTRHMLCHEFSHDISINNAEYFRFSTGAELLVSLTEVILMSLTINA